MTADRHAARRAVAFLAVVVLSLVAAFTLGSPVAVADTNSLSGTGVAASTFVDGDGVGPAGDVTAGQGRETTADSYDSALGCCVATRATGANGALRDPATGRFAANPNKPPSPVSSGTHGNSLSSPRETFLYQLEDAETGAHMKWGITSESNPMARYTQAELEGLRMRVIQSGSRADMAAVERWLVERAPGPMNHEPWAGSICPW